MMKNIQELEESLNDIKGFFRVLAKALWLVAVSSAVLAVTLWSIGFILRWIWSALKFGWHLGG